MKLEAWKRTSRIPRILIKIVTRLIMFYWSPFWALRADPEPQLVHVCLYRTQDPGLALPWQVSRYGRGITPPDSTPLYGTALNLNTLNYTALHPTALNCTALNFNTVNSTTLHRMALQSLDCTALLYTELQCIAARGTVLVCTALHSSTLQRFPELQ